MTMPRMPTTEELANLDPRDLFAPRPVGVPANPHVRVEAPLREPDWHAIADSIRNPDWAKVFGR